MAHNISVKGEDLLETSQKYPPLLIRDKNDFLYMGQMATKCKMVDVARRLTNVNDDNF